MFLVFVWLTAGLFTVYQYYREKQFKIDLLDERLQLLNTQLLGDYAAGRSPIKFYRDHRTMMKDLRLTLIRPNGTVIFDSESPVRERHENHLLRPEVQQALRHGSGHSIRQSETTGNRYFYSATKAGDLIARTAVYYNYSVKAFLHPGSSLLWLLLVLSVVFSILCYTMTRRLGENIRRLHRFAEKAGAGETIDANETFPNDELGEISNQIVKLYNRLLRTMDDRNRKRQAAIDEANDKIRLKRQLTSNINHELKTPLAAIRGYLETILSYPDMPQEQRDDFTRKSYDQTRRLSELLRDVTIISKLEEGASGNFTETVDVAQILHQVSDDMDMLPQEKRMALKTNIEGPLLVKGDTFLLHSIFENLMTNALRYSNGTTVTVTLVETTADHYKLVFADDGVGVDPDKLRYLFDRFYRVDKGRSRKLGGTGLGLSIVKNAIHSLGGTIEVANAEPHGLKFTLTLLRKLPAGSKE